MKFYKYPKVDSFDLYKAYVADTLLKYVVPKSRLFHKNHFYQVKKITNVQNKDEIDTEDVFNGLTSALNATIFGFETAHKKIYNLFSNNENM